MLPLYMIYLICRLNLAQRFQLYQFQQTDKQQTHSKKGGMSSSDDEMNFISMVEYQSLENSVRKFHVLTLQELREFWQGVRNSKSKEELAPQIERIGMLAKQTKNLYSTLMSMFII
jgi:hypothetical protein